MRVFKDVFSGDELVSDSYPQELLFDGCVLEVQSSWRMVGGESYVESNEEEGPGLDDQSERVIDIVDAFHLRQTAFNKKQYSLEIRAYMQRLRKWLTENNPERVEAFMAGAQGFVKHVVQNFDQYDFWYGSDQAEDNELGGMVVLSYYKDEELAPRFCFIVDGMNSVKY